MQNNLRLSAALLALAIAGTGTVAWGQEAAQQETTGLQEIVVTAQKRVESLQQAPLAISAISADTIEQRGITDVSSLTSVAPNLVVGQTGAASANIAIFIRGIGESDTVLTADSPVGLYVDGVVLGRTSGAIFDLVDLERIEVLRGPQGTLYGRNTTGGAVNLISKKPSDGFGLEQTISAGNLNYLMSKTSLDTGEIGDSGLKLRFTYLHKQRDGYIDNLLRRGNQDPGAYDVDAFRVAVRYDKDGPFRLDYAFDYNNRHSVSTPSQLVAARPDILAYLNASPQLGGEAPQIATTRQSWQRADTDGPIWDRITGHTLVAEADLSENLTLRSLTGYRDWKNTVVSDLDGNGGLKGLMADPGILAGGPLVPQGIGTVSLYNMTFARSQHQFSQEINLIGNIGEQIDFVLGGFYFREVANDASPTFFTLIIPAGAPVEAAPGVFTDSVGVNLTTDTIYRHVSRSQALFGQVTGHLSDALSLTGGLRYTKDKKRLQQSVPMARDITRDFNKLNWAASLDYQMDDNVLLYGRIATGYKAGGLNARSANDGFGPENLISYEAGLKTELFGRRLRLNTAAFYTRLKDIQRSQFLSGSGGTVSNTVNAGRSRYVGFEAEAMAAITNELTLSANIGYIDRKFKEFDYLDPTTDQLIDIAGVSEFQGSAGTTISAAADYRKPLSFGTFNARLDYNYRGRVYYTTSAVINPFHEEISDGPVGLFDARIGLSDLEIRGAKMAISAWAKNLTNKSYALWGVDFGALGFATTNFADKRSWGLELKIDLR